MKTAIKSIIIAIAVIAIIVIAFFVFHHQKSTAPQQQDSKLSNLPPQVVINTANQPTTGNRNAKLHFVAFEDLKCFNCMRYNVELYPKIKKEYIKTGKAKYTVINVAFIPGSLPAANAARCVYAQNKTLFFPYIKAIYDNQPPEDQNWATTLNLLKFANKVPGINTQKLTQCISQNPYARLINNNFKIAATVMNGTVATPTLYINGYIVKPLTMKRIHQIVEAVK